MEHIVRVAVARTHWYGLCLTCQWEGALRTRRATASTDAALHADQEATKESAMSMYNLIFGANHDAPKLLGALGLTRESFYRYRDAYLSESGEVAVYTRGGGGNRECYCQEYGTEDGEATVELDGETHTATCVVPKQTTLRQHPLYARDEDDDFDCTYATFYFRIPDEAQAILSDVAPQASREEVWQRLFDALGVYR